jgi:hypothetical protein
VESLACWDYLVPSRYTDSLWQAGRLQADFGFQLDGVSSDTLVRLASGLSEKCIKKQCGLAVLRFGGEMALYLHLSQVSRGIAAMNQDCNYQLDTTKLKRNGDKSTTIKNTHWLLRQLE